MEPVWDANMVPISVPYWPPFVNAALLDTKMVHSMRHRFFGGIVVHQKVSQMPPFLGRLPNAWQDIFFMMECSRARPPLFRYPCRILAVQQNSPHSGNGGPATADNYDSVRKRRSTCFRSRNATSSRCSLMLAAGRRSW
jgi:hypothetical protein